MTLHEHATKILKESNRKYLFSPTQQAIDTLFEAAYDELSADLDAEREKVKGLTEGVDRLRGQSQYWSDRTAHWMAEAARLAHLNEAADHPVDGGLYQDLRRHCDALENAVGELKCVSGGPEVGEPVEDTVKRAIVEIKQLRADLDAAKRDLLAAENALVHFETENLRLREQLVDTPIRPSTPDLDRIKRERAGARAALCYIRAALGLSAEDPLDPSAIAERAVRVINEHREKRPDPPKCLACGATRDTYGGHPMACRECESHKQPQPEPPKKAVYEWREEAPGVVYLNRDKRTVGVVRDRDADSTISPGWMSPRYTWNTTFGVVGDTTTLPLAQAAVEAVVRAHYGDEA